MFMISRFDMRAMELGNAPVMPVSEITNSNMLDKRAKRLCGKVPPRSKSRRTNRSKFVTEPSADGTEPRIKLALKLSSRSNAAPEMLDGIDPSSWFDCNCSLVKSVRVKMEEGTLPRKLFSAKFKSAKFTALSMSSGIVPSRVLEERSTSANRVAC